jgi:hypothetical protein
VFLAYASSRGHVLIGRELYLPKAWAAALDFILDWSLWRRCHQAMAKRCHWKHRAARRSRHKAQL